VGQRRNSFRGSTIEVQEGSAGDLNLSESKCKKHKRQREGDHEERVYVKGVGSNVVIGQRRRCGGSLAKVSPCATTTISVG
jgi:hypothetical protein